MLVRVRRACSAAPQELCFSHMIAVFPCALRFLAESTTLYGYIFVSRKKGWKRRWAVYQRFTRTLCLYQAREADLTSTVAFYSQAIEAPFRGTRP